MLNAHQELPRRRFTHPKGTLLALGWHGITGGPVSAEPQTPIDGPSPSALQKIQLPVRIQRDFIRLEREHLGGIWQ
ncbi:hypothetical protein QQF64_005630 [Cirrhinus molitorella]|uniref:Uncharacterized protein n=1 Tax=Cirrhinus molitorella TaxID=172907 RepID=A0ABR3MF48_9TELE